MSRPIKFRAWAVNTMLYPGYEGDQFPSIPMCGQPLGLANGGMAANYILMQWTGLLDSEGTEIWEGDVLHGSYGIPPVGVDFPVEFHAGAFYAITTGHNPDICLLAEAIEHLDARVIGNIHENPELME